MANVFLDSGGVIDADNGVTISAQYYNNLLHNDVHYAIRKKIPGNPSKIILLHDNACPQTVNLTKATLASIGWETTKHSPYGPDLDSSGFHFFGPMKAHIGRQKFQIQTRCPERATLCCWQCYLARRMGNVCWGKGRLSRSGVRVWRSWHVFCFVKNLTKIQVSLESPLYIRSYYNP
jgi:hypothetical protein